MRTLIIKRNATGDVVRTTTLLRRVEGEVWWVSESMNLPLIEGVRPSLNAVAWSERERVPQVEFDLIVNLEDDEESARFAQMHRARRRFGALVDESGGLTYSEDSKSWFDMSLISRFGRKRADELKLMNRWTYQDHLFSGLGWEFAGEEYLLPPVAPGDFAGDVAIAPVAGAVWPMKNWAKYEELIERLRGEGLVVNILPRRASLIEHLQDVASHRCLVSGDSLPMHFALGLRIPCVTLFSCTSPWEIFEYGVQTKIVSPLLEEFFYQRGMNSRATNAISVEEVCEAAVERLGIEAGRRR
jgi:hypothetical protein